MMVIPRVICLATNNSASSSNLRTRCVLSAFISIKGRNVPFLWDFSSLGGDDGIRTHDPLLAGQVLSQLSYTPRLFILGFCRFSVFNLHEVKISLFDLSKNFTRLRISLLTKSKISLQAVSLLGRPKWTRTTFEGLSLTSFEKRRLRSFKGFLSLLVSTGRPKWTRTTDLVLIRHAL